MSENVQQHEAEYGPLVCIWRSNEFGGLAVYARHDGFVYELYTDEAMSDCLGEAEDISEPHTWCLDLLSELGRLQPSVDGGPAKRR